VPLLVQAILFTLIPVAAATAAGIVAAAIALPARLQSGVQHFAAGVVFGAAAIELLPQLLQRSPAATLLGFALGIGALFALRWATERVEKARAGVAGFVAATAVDFLVDGLVIGAGFTAGGHTGVLLTVAVAIEYLFVGMSVAAALGDHVSPARVIGVPLGLALLTPVGAIVGAVALQGVPLFALATVLAFGAVAFMYLVTEELLVRAHEQGETALGSPLFFVGFLILLVIEEIV